MTGGHGVELNLLADLLTSLAVSEGRIKGSLDPCYERSEEVGWVPAPFNPWPQFASRSFHRKETWKPVVRV